MINYRCLSVRKVPQKSSLWWLSGCRHLILTLGVVATFTCAVNTNAVAAALPQGMVTAWGANFNGQTNVPDKLEDVTMVAAGLFHSIALKADGTVVAWGDNSYQQTVIPAGLKDVKAIAAGGGHSLALRNDGTVEAWGANGSGQRDIPAGLKDVIAIAAGNSHSLALKSNGTVIGWGSDFYGQGTVPEGLTDVIAIAAGRNHSMALKKNGTVMAWGDDIDNQRTVPDGLEDVTAIAAGSFHSLALKTNGIVVAWGSNNFGERTVPAAALTGVKAIAAGGASSLALKTDGTIVEWGSNFFGLRVAPVGLTRVTAIAAGSFHSLAATLTYSFSGFLPPVNNPDVVNLGKVGRTYPIKWQLKDADGNFLTSLTAIKSVTFKPVQCGAFTSIQAGALEAETSGKSGLSYDDTSNQYQYNWATPSAGCYVLFLSLDTGQVRQAYFNFRN
ncbi:MAG TPA: PxKF domain-containing protein [Noviherbaspirillum sp.]